MGTLGEELKVRMDGRPQKLVAKRIGISQQHLSAILADRVPVTIGRAAEGILRWWPDLCFFILPEDILISIYKCVQERDAGAEHSGK